MIVVLALAASLAGCDRREPASSAGAPPQSALDPDQAAGEAAYLAPPAVQSVRVQPGGSLDVRGRAPARSGVVLASPDGDQLRVQAGAAGKWRLRLPPDGRPRLFAISAMTGGRTLHAEGALLLAPGALSPGVTLRAGAAALPLAPADGTLDIATVDYDPSGALAAAGGAPAGAAVTLAVDGMAAAAGQADAQGVYALVSAGRRLGMGLHRLTVAAAGRTTARQVELTPPAPLSTPFTAARSPEGWRIEWAPTGGGVQTTLVLAP